MEKGIVTTIKSLFKKIPIPSGEMVEVTAYKSWTVRWVSVKNDGSFRWLFNDQEEAEVFIDEEEAKKFAMELRKARKLLKDNFEGIRITANQ